MGQQHGGGIMYGLGVIATKELTSDGGPTSGTPIPLTDKLNLMNHSNWDTNEPGHSEGGTSFGSVQRFFGVKRDNGKWHDFHGQDQGNSGREASVGFLALCQSTQPWD